MKVFWVGSMLGLKNMRQVYYVKNMATWYELRLRFPKNQTVELFVLSGVTKFKLGIM